MTDRTKSDGLRALNRLELYVTILGTVLGLLFTWSQLRIAHSEEERARRTEPLSYTLQAVETHYEYEIFLGEKIQTITAPSLRLRVTHGSLYSVTAISYDGTEFHQLETLPIQDSWSGCTVDITLPPQSIQQEKGLIYDYFFLYLEPVEGERRLDLVYNVISLEEQEVTTSVMHRIELVKLDSVSQGAQREMLGVYARLSDKLEDLGLLAA